MQTMNDESTADLVKRLRMEARRDPEIQHCGHSILSDAADEIERLAAQLADAKSVMKIVGVSERDIDDPTTMLALWKHAKRNDLDQGGISDRLSNFDEYGNRIRDRT